MRYARMLFAIAVLVASGCCYSRVVVEFRAQALITPAGPVTISSKVDLIR